MHNRVEPDNPPLNYALNKVSGKIEKLLQQKEMCFDNVTNSSKFDDYNSYPSRQSLEVKVIQSRVILSIIYHWTEETLTQFSDICQSD